MGTIEAVKTVNSFLRTLVAISAVGLVALGGWWGFSAFHADEAALKEKDQALAEAQAELDKSAAALKSSLAQVAQQQTEIVALEKDVQEKQVEIDRLDTALHLLKVDHRLARITVLDQTKADNPRDIITRFEFVEINDDDAPIDAPKVFEVKGKMIWVDAWVVKFKDHHIERADVDRATSICLFRRIWGEFQEPSEGFPLDKQWTRPTAYARGDDMSPFEKSIWDDFWNIANDIQKAEEKGIRDAHGQAVSIELRPDKTYRLQLRASDGLSIVPADKVPMQKPAT